MDYRLSESKAWFEGDAGIATDNVTQQDFERLWALTSHKPTCED